MEVCYRHQRVSAPVTSLDIGMDHAASRECYKGSLFKDTKLNRACGRVRKSEQQLHTKGFDASPTSLWSATSEPCPSSYVEFTWSALIDHYCLLSSNKGVTNVVSTHRDSTWLWASHVINDATCSEGVGRVHLRPRRNLSATSGGLVKGRIK